MSKLLVVLAVCWVAAQASPTGAGYGGSSGSVPGKAPNPANPVPAVVAATKPSVAVAKPSTTCTDIDTSKNCCFWASLGECTVNTMWMATNCAQSCGTCTCTQSDKSMCTVAVSADCTLTSGQKSIPDNAGTNPVPNTVLSGTCVDTAKDCCAWQAMGECTSNPFWMRVNCQKACGTCGCTTDQALTGAKCQPNSTPSGCSSVPAPVPVVPVVVTAAPVVATAAPVAPMVATAAPATAAPYVAPVVVTAAPATAAPYVAPVVVTAAPATAVPYVAPVVVTAAPATVAPAVARVVVTAAPATVAPAVARVVATAAPATVAPAVARVVVTAAPATVAPAVARVVATAAPATVAPAVARVVVTAAPATAAPVAVTAAPVPSGTCTDTDISKQCCFWASLGECKANTLWMAVNCAKSCGTCDCKETDKSKCTVAVSPACTLASGQKALPDNAGTNPVPNTDLSGTCVDTAQDCCAWQAMGECLSNPFWMRVNCQKACGTCGCTLDQALQGEKCQPNTFPSGCPGTPLPVPAAVVAPVVAPAAPVVVPKAPDVAVAVPVQPAVVTTKKTPAAGNIGYRQRRH